MAERITNTDALHYGETYWIESKEDEYIGPGKLRISHSRTRRGALCVLVFIVPISSNVVTAVIRNNDFGSCSVKIYEVE